MKTRQDAWTEQNDSLLAETVLRHIREGSTQLNAFEEVGDKLNRTSAACGFRWNAVVRDQFDKEIMQAKKQRKQRQRALKAKTRPLYIPPAPELVHMEEFADMAPLPPARPKQAKETINLTIEDVITYLQGMAEGDQEEQEQLKLENKRMTQENEQIETEINQLQKQIEKTEQEYNVIQQDYQALVQIMDRARKMVLFEDEELPTHTFKMDRNGNLEKVAK